MKDQEEDWRRKETTYYKIIETRQNKLKREWMSTENPFHFRFLQRINYRDGSRIRSL